MTTIFKEVAEMASKEASKVMQEVKLDQQKAAEKARRKGRVEDDPIDGIVRAVAAGIGFVSEAYHCRKEKSNEAKNGEKEACSITADQRENTCLSEQEHQATSEPDGIEDVLQAEQPHLPKESRSLAKAFVNRHPPPSDRSDGKLEAPVVLAQRRPKNRARGFVHAYAPSLGDVGIDQETFIDFIDTFNQALEPNPWLYAINLAGLAGMEAPDPFMLLIGLGVGLATEAIMEGHSRLKSNSFLDHVNAGFFVPRGLLCLVATWKSDAGDDLVTTVDFHGKAQAAESRSRSLAQKIKAVQDMMGTSIGSFQWPDAAPLVFPSPDELDEARLAANGGKKLKRENAVDRSEKWLDGYIDRQAQAKWIKKNPRLPMTSLLPKPTFHSRYADPSHPAASGDIVALVTGGRWQYKYREPPADDAEAEDGASSRKDSPPKEKKHAKEGFMSILQKVRYLQESTATRLARIRTFFISSLSIFHRKRRRIEPLQPRPAEGKQSRHLFLSSRQSIKS